MAARSGCAQRVLVRGIGLIHQGADHEHGWRYLHLIFATCAAFGMHLYAPGHMPLGRCTAPHQCATIVSASVGPLAAVDAENRSLRKGSTPPGLHVVTDLPRPCAMRRLLATARGLW